MARSISTMFTLAGRQTQNKWVTIQIAVLVFCLPLHGCGTDEDCTPNDHVICREGAIYWVDSCDNEGNKAEDCACGCSSDYRSCKTPCACVPGCGADEICDEETGRCKPECLPTEKERYFPDLDGDGYGDSGATGVESCKPPENHVTDNSDCNDDPDDNGSSIHPDATETCNEVDDNCNSEIDEGFEKVWAYLDQDRDGHGSILDEPVLICQITDGFVSDQDPIDDCADEDARAHPGNQDFFDEEITGPSLNDLKWDFNCDGIEEKRWENSGHCRISDCSMESAGWAFGIPACGVESNYIAQCPFYDPVCHAYGNPRVQECR